MFRVEPSNDPIIVVVKNGRYDCYGPDNLRSAFLMETLKRQGGISDTVADGTYHYNVRREGLKLHASLYPAPQ